MKFNDAITSEHVRVVYKIMNMHNNRFYVGSCKELAIRIPQHLNKLRNDKHAIITFQDDFNKYGEDSFLIEILYEGRDYKVMESDLIWDLNPFYNLVKPKEEYISYSIRLSRFESEILAKWAEKNKTDRNEYCQAIIKEFIKLHTL